MYNITVFKKSMFRIIFYSFIILNFFIIPVSSELLEEFYEGVNIYSRVNNSWDYSTRYEILDIIESESLTNYEISTGITTSSGITTNWVKQYEDIEPLKMYIDFDLNPSLQSVICESPRIMDESFIEATSFYIMSGSNQIGYGSFFMWADTENFNKLVYLFDFEYIDDLSGSYTYDIVYGDDTIFYSNYDLVYQYYYTQTGGGCRYPIITPNGGGVYISGNRYSRSGLGSSTWACCSTGVSLDEKITVNTIENTYISENNIYYHYDIDSIVGYAEVDNIQSGYKIGLTHDLYNISTEDNNEYYIYDTNYRSTNQQQNNNRELGVKIDLYTNSGLNYPKHTFILDYGGISKTDSGYYGSTEGINYIKFNPDSSYSDNSHQYFDYNIHNSYSEYSLFVTSVVLHPNYPNGIEDYQNYLYNNLTGNHILLENEFTFVPNVYCLRLYATVSYPAFVEDAILLAESNPISITTEYIPPEEPPEYPDQPPNATSINQTLNNSWSDVYYDIVLSTNEFFYLPVYNLFVWTMLPITDLSNNMILYNDAMQNSFSESSSEIAVLSASISIITSGFHPKVVNLMTYYLIWLVLLIILRKF